jgi:hypothetical protein
VLVEGLRRDTPRLGDLADTSSLTLDQIVVVIPLLRPGRTPTLPSGGGRRSALGTPTPPSAIGAADQSALAALDADSIVSYSRMEPPARCRCLLIAVPSSSQLVVAEAFPSKRLR